MHQLLILVLHLHYQLYLLIQNLTIINLINVLQVRHHFFYNIITFSIYPIMNNLSQIIQNVHILYLLQIVMDVLFLNAFQMKISHLLIFYYLMFFLFLLQVYQINNVIHLLLYHDVDIQNNLYILLFSYMLLMYLFILMLHYQHLINNQTSNLMLL